MPMDLQIRMVLPTVVNKIDSTELANDVLWKTARSAEHIAAVLDSLQ